MSYIKKYCDGWDDGYASGLDAAREAVKGFLIGDTDCDRKYWEVIDAIDALKEKP